MFMRYPSPAGIGRTRGACSEQFREGCNIMNVILGAVAYDPKVVTIWEGFKLYFEKRGVRFDYVLYSNYERQVEALIDGVIHVAWNSPLAWIRSYRLARARGLSVQPIAM